MWLYPVCGTRWLSLAAPALLLAAVAAAWWARSEPGPVRPPGHPAATVSAADVGDEQSEALPPLPAMSEETRALLRRARECWAQIRTAEGTWEGRTAPFYGYPWRAARFCYQAPGRVRVEALDPDPAAGSVTLIGGTGIQAFSASHWTLTRSEPAPDSLVPYTPGCADLEAIARRVRRCSLVREEEAAAGAQVVEFSDPLETAELWTHRVLRFRVDAESGKVLGSISYAPCFPNVREEWVYEDPVVIGGVTVARRARCRRGGGAWESVAYGDLRVNESIVAERFRFQAPAGTAVLPAARGYSLLATKRYLAQHPADAGGHARYAEVLLVNAQGGERRHARGLEELEKAIALDPAAGYYHLMYARQVRYGRGASPADAERHLKAALAACPAASAFHREWVEFLLSQGRTQEAGAALHSGLERTRPHTGWGIPLQIRALSRGGSHEAAIAAGRALMERTGDWAELSTTLYTMAWDSKRVARAVREYRRLLADPGFPDDAFRSAAKALLDAERARGRNVVGAWREAFRRRPLLAVPLALFDVPERDQGRVLPEVVAFLEAEVRRRPGVDETKLWLAEALAELRSKERAVALLQDIAGKTDEWRTVFRCAEVLWRLNEKDAVTAAQVAFVRRHPGHEQARRETFCQLYDARLYAEALEVWGDPLRPQPRPPWGRPAATDNRFLVCYRELGRLPELLKRIRAELQRESASFRLQVMLGDALGVLPDAAAAREAWLRLAEQPTASRDERLLIAHRLQAAGRLAEAAEQLSLTAALPVTQDDVLSHADMHATVLPEEYDRFAVHAQVLNRLADLQDRLGRAAQAEATHARLVTLRAELGLSEFETGVLARKPAREARPGGAAPRPKGKRE